LTQLNFNSTEFVLREVLKNHLAAILIEAGLRRPPGRTRLRVSHQILARDGKLVMYI